MPHRLGHASSAVVGQTAFVHSESRVTVSVPVSVRMAEWVTGEGVCVLLLALAGPTTQAAAFAHSESVSTAGSPCVLLSALVGPTTQAVALVGPTKEAEALVVPKEAALVHHSLTLWA